MQKYPMTDAEIVKTYKEAKNKKTQIEILADLNCCKASDIKTILKNNGVDLRGGDYRSKKAADAVPDQKQEAGEVKEQAREDKDAQKELKLGKCLKDITGSCVGCDEVDICTGYKPPLEILSEVEIPEVKKDKPAPAGLIPRAEADREYNEFRTRDIIHAMCRYYDADLPIPEEWKFELKDRL